MHIFRFLGALVLSAVLFTGCAVGKQLTQDAGTDSTGIPAFSVAQIRAGEVVTYGSNGEEDTAETMFEAGSNGKMIAAYLCLKLVDEGALSLDGKIQTYLPKEWVSRDSRFSQITVRNLLSHTAGFSPSFEFGVDRNIYFAPGSHFSYSGVGYIYLQKIIEQVTGQGFEEAARSYVFEPLKMGNSTFAVTSTETPFVMSSSFVLYSCAVWLVLGLAVYGIGFLAGVLTKFRFYRKQTLFYMSVAVSFLFAILLLSTVLPRMIVPFLLLGAVSVLLLFVTRKLHKLKYSAFLVFLAAFTISGMLFRFQLPMGPVLVSRQPNAAYSLNICTEDLTRFAEELLHIYESGSPVMKEMFMEQVKIDEGSGWCAGLAVEHGEQADTFWHSGINPGMQSLFVLCPERKDAAIIMTNSDYGLAFAQKEAARLLGIDGVWEIVRTDLTQLK